MAQSRLPLSWILGATALALAAASLVVIVGSGGGDEASGDNSDGGTLQLDDPPDNLPPSVHDVVLQDFEGEATRPLHSYMDGKPVVVNFFAAWCTPCIQEMPAFESVHQSLGEEVNIVGLAVPPNTADAQDLVGRTGVTYPTFVDPDGAAVAFFESVQMPTTVFVAPDGEVLEVSNGELDEDEIRSKIAEHFGIESGS